MSVSPSEREAMLSRVRQNNPSHAVPAPVAAPSSPPPYTVPGSTQLPYAMPQAQAPQQPQMQMQPAAPVTQGIPPGRQGRVPGTIRATNGGHAQFVDNPGAPGAQVAARGANVVQDTNRGATIKMQGASRPTGVRGAQITQQAGAPMPVSTPGHGPVMAPATAGTWSGGSAIPRAQQTQLGAAIANLTVVLSQHARPQHLETQLRALRASSVQPHAMFCWVNPAGVPLDDRMLAGILTVRASKDMGPWCRWRMAAEADTKYVLVIDDDCIPGTDWLKAALDRIHAAEQRDEHIIVCAGGLLFTEDRFDAIFPAGPEAPRLEEQAVDVGRGAWLFAAKHIEDFNAFPRMTPDGLLSQPLHFAAALQHEGVTQVVLPYPPGDRACWGMQEPPKPDGTSAIIDNRARAGQDNPAMYYRQQAYMAYRAGGWEPWCVLGPKLQERERNRLMVEQQQQRVAAEKGKRDAAELARRDAVAESKADAPTVELTVDAG